MPFPVTESDALRLKKQTRDELDAEPRLSWLLRRKVCVPDRTVGYMERASLVERAMPTRSRLTVLIAPGGFGKTTLLAECCRRLAERGIVTAWICIDESDEADVLDAYIAFAFQYAGLTIEGASERDGATESRAGLLARALEARGESFVLALDDLHRLKDPEAVALLDFLIQRGPPNLHLAAACRRLPAGLNVAGPVLDGQAAVLGADNLRFSKSEISDFFDRRLSRRELVSLAEESAGWPMALRIQRNGTGVTQGAGETRSIVENWVESRLWEGIDADDRELVLDVGLFEWMDEELLDEVLGGNDSMRRLQTMEALVGFLEPVRGSGADAWRLHPLIAEHCALQRFRDARARFRDVHRRIAVALARRGETLLALRHGAESGDIELAGDIVEEAGGIRLWLRYGLVQFRAATELLDGNVIEARPRLRIARCAALVFAGRLEQARQIYRSIAAETHDETAFERWVDFCILRGIVIFYGGGTIGSEQSAASVADCLKIADCERAEPLVRAYAEHSLCIAHSVSAQFAPAMERADRARARFGTSGFGRMMVEIQRGQAAMAQGQVTAARNRYTQAMRVAKASYVHEPVWATIAGALLRELDLERNRLAPSSLPPGIPATLTKSGTPAQASCHGIARSIDLRNGNDVLFDSRGLLRAFDGLLRFRFRLVFGVRFPRRTSLTVVLKKPREFGVYSLRDTGCVAEPVGRPNPENGPSESFEHGLADLVTVTSGCRGVIPRAVAFDAGEVAAGRIGVHDTEIDPEAESAGGVDHCAASCFIPPVRARKGNGTFVGEALTLRSFERVTRAVLQGRTR